MEVITAITNHTEAEDNKVTRELQANLARYEVEPNPEVAKVVKTGGGAEVTEVIKIEVTASEVTAPTEVTKEDPMTKTDQEEEEEDVGEEGVLMGTSSGEPTKTTHIEMLIIWATTMGILVLYQYSSLNLHHHCTS